MLRIVATTYQFRPLFYLFIPTSAFSQQPTLRWGGLYECACEGSLTKLPQRAGGLWRWEKIASGIRKPSGTRAAPRINWTRALSPTDPAFSPQRLSSPLLTFPLLSLSFCGVFTSAHPRSMRASSSPCLCCLPIIFSFNYRVKKYDWPSLASPIHPAAQGLPLAKGLCLSNQLWPTQEVGWVTEQKTWLPVTAPWAP